MKEIAGEPVIMPSELAIRTGDLAEKPALEALQMRASLMWEKDREMLLCNPEAVSIPVAQFTSGMVLVATQSEAFVRRTDNTRRPADVMRKKFFA